jgi:hypothetical protein
MNSSIFRLRLLAGGLLFTVSASLAQTDIRPTPGGKRILFVDGDDIRPEPGGKRLLFVDGEDIRPEPGGKRLLFVDKDGDVRPNPNGIRIAFWDGDTLRRSPGGPIILFLDGDDVRPDMGGPRLYFLDGPALSKQQLTAVLMILKPELFQLSKEETAAKEKEFAANAAASQPTTKAESTPNTANAKTDPWVGNRPITSQRTGKSTKREGTIDIAKQGKCYTVTYKTGENPEWRGIGVPIEEPGMEPEIWAVVGPASAVALGAYVVKDGKLDGTWIPVNATGEDRSVLGFEKLRGAAELGGQYTIESGKLPNGGTEYSGALQIEPLPVKDKEVKCYRILWSNGATAVGFLIKDKLFVGAGWGEDWEVVRIRPKADSFALEFLNKSGQPGSYTLSK